VVSFRTCPYRYKSGSVSHHKGRGRKADSPGWHSLRRESGWRHRRSETGWHSLRREPRGHTIPQKQQFLVSPDTQGATEPNPYVPSGRSTRESRRGHHTGREPSRRSSSIRHRPCRNPTRTHKGHSSSGCNSFARPSHDSRPILFVWGWTVYRDGDDGFSTKDDETESTFLFHFWGGVFGLFSFLSLLIGERREGLKVIRTIVNETRVVEADLDPSELFTF
jgi:hypothetical protein